MRKIKYRGKVIEDGKWVYGYYYYHEPPLQCFADDKAPTGKAYICHAGFADWNMPRPVGAAEVLPGTVGMFTGMLDKEGKEIYEDDVLTNSSGKKYRVYWDEDDLAWKLALFPVGEGSMYLAAINAHQWWKLVTIHGEE